MKLFGQNWVILVIYHTTSDYHGGVRILGPGVNSVSVTLYIYHTTSDYHGGLRILGPGVKSVIFSRTSL